MPARRALPQALPALVAVLVLLVATQAAVPPSPVHAATLPPGFTETVIAGGMSSTTSMAFAPDGRIFVTQQAGAVRVIKNGALLPTPFVTVSTETVGERGLLGVAVDPQFADNGFVYLHYTVLSSPRHNRVSRFKANGDVAIPGSEVPILELDNQGGAFHQGGAIHFGTDGKLYIAVGDDGASANSQSLNTRHGKVLRINPDGTIPPNPFDAGAVGPNRAIWAMGLRNPFTFAVQPGTGRIFINDVGEVTWEEINDGIPGSNHGWPATEGATANPNFRSPLYSYHHNTGDPIGCAITGGAFYNAPVMPFPVQYHGKYFFSDVCSGFIRTLDPVSNVSQPFATGFGQPVDLAVPADGKLYVLSRIINGVIRIDPPAPAPTPECAGTTASLWSPATTPGTPSYPDGGNYELGVKFRADVSGTVCGVKFYKGAGNLGTHTGRLWTTGGVLLASGTFTGETSSGWQTLTFATGVPIQAGTTYVVSYGAPSGFFSFDFGYFNSQHSNAPLAAPASVAAGGNGVYAFGTGNFPALNGNGGNFWVDVVFAASVATQAGGCTGTTRTVFAAAAQPEVAAHPDTGAYSLGAKFMSEVPGLVCGVRFYKGVGNGGTHTGHLWSNGGAMLASTSFVNESALGWQQSNFASPVAITANTTYVVSYTAPNGRFAYNPGQLTSNGVDNPPLHIPSNAASGGNGVYGAPNSFPNQVSAGSNFWVDVVFQPQATLWCAAGTVTVFSPASTPATPAFNDAGSYEIGVKFTADVAGQVCGVRYYKGPGNDGTHVGRLWSANGTQLAFATFTGETATGWQQVLFSQPVQITANTTYVASYSDPLGRFALNAGQLNSSIDNAPLHLPSSAASGGNGVYAPGTGNFPSFASAGNNFWVDVVFAPGSPAGGVSDSCTNGSSGVFLPDSTPGTPSHPDPNAYEFGMRFRPDVNGVACGVRFYKGTGNTGTHTGRLWSNGGASLASVTFTGETASGWQQALFSQPFALTANTTYVVSYTDPNGHFSFNAGTFNSQVNNGMLHAPAGNGLFGPPGSFPTMQNNSNFWVDVLFAPTCPCSVWSNAYTPVTPAHPDAGEYELGVKLRSDQNGFVSGVKFYKGAGNTGQHVGRVWRVDGTLMASAVFTNETATGWQSVLFATPVFMPAGETFVVSYSDPFGRFGHDPNYFVTAVESGPLLALSNATPGGQALYGALGQFPAFSAVSAGNFWVDVVWTSPCLGCATAMPPPPGQAAFRAGPSPFPAPGTMPALPPPPVVRPPQEIRPPPGESLPVPSPGGMTDGRR